MGNCVPKMAEDFCPSVNSIPSHSKIVGEQKGGFRGERTHAGKKTCFRPFGGGGVQHKPPWPKTPPLLGPWQPPPPPCPSAAFS